jgi:hypothetical protein
VEFGASGGKLGQPLKKLAWSDLESALVDSEMVGEFLIRNLIGLHD